MRLFSRFVSHNKIFQWETREKSAPSPRETRQLLHYVNIELISVSTRGLLCPVWCRVWTRLASESFTHTRQWAQFVTVFESSLRVGVLWVPKSGLCQSDHIRLRGRGVISFVENLRRSFVLRTRVILKVLYLC